MHAFASQSLFSRSIAFNNLVTVLAISFPKFLPPQSQLLKLNANTSNIAPKPLPSTTLRYFTPSQVTTLPLDKQMQVNQATFAGGIEVRPKSAQTLAPTTH